MWSYTYLSEVVSIRVRQTPTGLQIDGVRAGLKLDFVEDNFGATVVATST